MLDAKTAQLMHQFMGRVDLKGSEVPAYIRCMQVLEQIIYTDQMAQQQPQPAMSPQLAPEPGEVDRPALQRPN